MEEKRWILKAVWLTGRRKSGERELRSNVYYKPNKVYTDPLYGDLFKVTSCEENPKWVRPERKDDDE